MGKASSYFYAADTSDTQTLHRRIIPSNAQYDEQQVRWNELAEFLLSELGKRSGYPIKSWLQGSYKFGTQIRPIHMTQEFDIDLGVYFCWKGDREAGNYEPKELKQFVQESLKQFASTNDDVIEVASPAKPRCCRVRFKGSFHIDVPCYHLDDQVGNRSLATEENEWEDSDPKAIYAWFKDQFQEERRAKVRRLVRFLKAWAALKFREAERPSSLLLTVLVAEAAKATDPLPEDDDDALSAVLCKISDRLNAVPDVPNPIDITENLTSRLPETSRTAFIDRIGSFAERAVSASRDENTLSACSQWAMEFEHLFPLPEPGELDELAKSLPAVRTLPEVKVTAVSRENELLRYSGINEIGPIPKKCDIAFEVINSFSLPPGTQFLWTVRNEGEEAEDTNDLGHTAGIGLKAQESSAYKGTHFMDCTAVLSGKTIGLRRVRVKISGASPIKRRMNRAALLKLIGKR